MRDLELNSAYMDGLHIPIFSFWQSLDKARTPPYTFRVGGTVDAISVRA